MSTTTSSKFRNEQSRYLEIAQNEPVKILSRGTRPRAVVVSVDFYERAIAAMEDADDARAAEAARREGDEITHEELKKVLDIE